MLRDARYALRLVRRNPIFVAAIVLTLGIGIGANTTVFSFVNAVFIKPLPYPEADQLVQLWGIHRTSGADGGVSVANFLDWKQQSRAFAGLAAYQFDPMNLGGQGAAERVTAIRVSADFLPILRGRPTLGQAFGDRDYLPGSSAAVLVSWGAWQRRWGGQPNILGSQVVLDGKVHSIVGVLPAEFRIRFPFCGQGHAALPEPEFWLPLVLDASTSSRSTLSLLTLARLKPNVTIHEAQAEMKIVAGRLEQQYPEANKGWETVVLPLHELKTNAGVAGPILLTPVALVLLIACVNVTNMLLAKAATRRKEIALRTALGANRLHLVRQLLSEGLLLALLGGALGVLFAYWGCSFIRTMCQETMLILPEVRVDRTALLFTVGISLVTGLVVGLIPALQGSRSKINVLLQDGATTVAAGLPGRRLSPFLVVTEVTLALVLLSATGLLLRSLVWTWNVDLGFRTDRILALDLALPTHSQPSLERHAAAFEQLLRQVRARPEIESAAFVSSLPTANHGMVRFRIVGAPSVDGDGQLRAGFTSVGPGYFSLMSIPLRTGRDFRESDGAGAPGVVLVNEVMARKYWPQSNPLGATLDLSGKLVTVVGVIGNVARPHVAGVSEAGPELFVPYPHWPSSQMSLVIKSRQTDMAAIASTLRSTIASFDSSLAIAKVQTLASAVSHGMAVGYLIMTLMGFFALAALLLAAIGVYGLIAFAVARRTREIGVRMAIGARPADITCMVLGQGARLLALALVFGIPLSLGTGKVLARWLYRVSPVDAPVLGAMVILLAATTLLACYFPARRAARYDPLVALRSE